VLTDAFHSIGFPLITESNSLHVIVSGPFWTGSALF